MSQLVWLGAFAAGLATTGCAASSSAPSRSPSHMSASKAPPAAPSAAPPAAPSATTTTSPPSTSPASTSPPSTSPSEAEAEFVEWVLPADGGRGRFRDLSVEVLDVTEKRTMDGDGMMRITLRLRAGGNDETVQITSSEPSLAWHGFQLEYRGGWRSEVRLTVKRSSDPHP